MTCIRFGKTLAFAALAMIAAPLAAQDDIFAITQPVALDESDPSREEVGELIYRGGVAIDPGEEEIGGISGLEWHEEEGKLYAVSDDGHWLRIEPDEFDGRIIDVVGLSRGELKDERGRGLRGKDGADAEAITRAPGGGWMVVFEREHRVWGYEELGADARPLPVSLDPFIRPGSPNAGIEAFARAGEDTLVCGEFFAEGVPNCRHSSGAAVDQLILGAPQGEAIPVPTDAACDGAGTCYILLRSYTRGLGNHIAILRHASGEDPELVAALGPELTVDNFEGLALREQFGRSFLYLVSDNNFSDDQRTLLMKFEIKSQAPQVAATPEPVVEYETVDVLLETEMGDITVRLETERAPITAANFLRYVDEDRFDGTVFYRAMKLDREPRPNGLIQGGTQFDPNRILPGIAHEPTTQTGLSHTNGALSMAMLEPGSANGDFSIMLADQTGLDAQPDSPDAIWRNGYAVFGYVIDGMDVVSAIHAAPADPDKGEGVMRGQILADPVEIIDARRLEPLAQ